MATFRKNKLFRSTLVFAEEMNSLFNKAHVTYEVVIVLERKMEFEVEGETHHLQPGEELFITAGALQSARNIGNTTARWLYRYGRWVCRMPDQTRIVAPGPSDDTVRTSDGQILHAPTDWELLPPGDAGLTRRLKAAGPTWTVQEKKGRKTFSRGVWALAERIAAIRDELEAERSTDTYAKRRASESARRDRKHAEYVEDFRGAVVAFLDFATCYADLADQLADAVTEHATPVGSGTVARTQRIPIEQRAESAVIAWLRHQTTAYDNMNIVHVKGKRRDVRLMLAEESRRLLENYRNGQPLHSTSCPLQLALAQAGTKENTT